jgi:hypothetical protein
MPEASLLPAATMDREVEVKSSTGALAGPAWRNLAFLRAVCCEALEDYRAAVLFFADAARWVPTDPTVLSALAPLRATR